MENLINVKISDKIIKDLENRRSLIAELLNVTEKLSDLGYEIKCEIK